MLKNCILLLYIWVSAFSHAQANYYNKTIDIDNVHNGFHGITHINGDTVLIDGFLQDQHYKRYRTFSFINAINGDTITSFKYGNDTLDIYGGMAIDVIVVNDLIYCCGTCYKNGKTYANFLKFDMNGTLLLDTLFKTNLEWSEFESMIPTNDGNFLILGNIENIQDNLDAWLVKVDYSGNIMWEKTYGGPEINGTCTFVETIDGNYLIATVKQYSNSSDTYLIKVDNLGEIIWEKTLNYSIFLESANCKSLNNGDIILTGFREYQNNQNEAFAFRINIEGHILWEKYFEKSENGFNKFVFSYESQNGNILINAGILDELIGFNPIGMTYCLSPIGDSIWARKFLLRENDHYLLDIEPLENGDLLMTGYVFPDSPNNTEDGWIMRTNCLGYFEHPKDSIVLIGSGENVLSLTNYSSYYDYTIVDWGDNSSDTVYASGNQNIMHEYSLPGNYSINTTTIACNDTIHKSSEYLVIPEQYESSNLVIFPNPNQGQFEIWLNSPDLYSLEIMDLNGRIVKSALNVKMNQGYIIDLSELGSSIYLVRAAKDENIIQQRVVVIR